MFYVKNTGFKLTIVFVCIHKFIYCFSNFLTFSVSLLEMYIVSSESCRCIRLYKVIKMIVTFTVLNRQKSVHGLDRDSFVTSYTKEA